MKNKLGTLVALAVMTIALVAVGCGEDGSQDKVTGALGGQGEADAKRLGDYLKVVQALPTTDIAIVQALGDEDRQAATDAIEKLRRIHTESGEVARGFEGERLRTFFVDYSDRIGDVAGAYQRVIDVPANADPATVTRLVDDLKQAKEPLQRLDDKLLATVREALPPEQQDEVERTTRSLTEQYKQATTP